MKAQDITSGSSSTAPLDGYLFLVRHLLVLKEVEVSLELIEPQVNGESAIEYGPFAALIGLKTLFPISLAH
jgi:hypothetical protein